MNRPDGMSRRTMKALNGPTKASRKVERSRIGKLSELVVQPKTKLRYDQAFSSFCSFHNLAKDFRLPEFHLFDDWVADYVEQLWETG